MIHFRSLALLLLAALPALALEGRILLPNGEPAAGSRIAVVGRSGSIRASADGSFRIDPSPPLPATLIVTGARGEVYPPVRIDRDERSTIRLEPAFQESVTVVSGVAPNIEAPPAAATSVAGQEDLDERQPQTLVEALEGVAGVAKTEESAAAVPVIRGLSGGRTLILVDGARVATERRAGASASFVDPFALGSVEVSRGPGSVAYGSDAFGGVIHAVPRDPVRGDPHVRYAIRASAGGAPLLTAAAEGSVDAGAGALLFLIRGRRASDQKGGHGETIDHSSFRDAGLALRWVRDSPRGRLRIALASDRADDLERPTIDSDVVRVSYPEEISDRLTLAFDGTPAAGWNAWELRAFGGRSELTTDRRRVEAESIERAIVSAVDASLRLTGTRPWKEGALQAGGELVSRLGLEADSVRIEPDGPSRERSIEDASRHAVAAFVTWDRPLGDTLSTALGLRADHVRSHNEGGWFGDRSIDHTALSGHAALTWRASERVRATFQLARGFREPTLSDRFFRGTTARGFITGNPELEPERSLQLDASLRWSGRAATAALFAWAYRIDDLVERFRDGSEFRFRNRGEADLRGIELEVTAPLGAGLELQLAGAVARGESGEGAPIDEIAAPNAQATLRWAGARGFVFVRAHAASEDDRPGPLELPRPGHATVDLSAGWRWRPETEVILAVENVLDRAYFASADESSPFAPGRTITLALLGRFDRE